jgi:hypothetical protein
VATNATIFIFIKSDGVVVIFSAGQQQGDGKARIGAGHTAFAVRSERGT